MKDLQIFNFRGLDVRTVLIDGEPYFVGKDVADVLGYKKPENAVANHVDEEDKTTTLIQGTGSNYKSKTVIVNESGLYSLILSSKLPTAKKFKHWVTSEVLPAIRKHGAYMTDEKAFDVVNNKSGLADLLQQAADQLKQKDIQIAELKPKALFADSVATSNSTILVGELAKILRGNGIEIGQNRLFDWLRKNGYLISKKGSSYNLPTQKSMNLGLFKIKETTINHSNGSVSISKTAKVTGKGQQYFINKFLNCTKVTFYGSDKKLVTYVDGIIKPSQTKKALD
ncbi:phage repressor protein/antirepressor Ant [Lactobacillus mulieris]|uniref:phage antirepressor n=1 Tax=Lactobacillus TaxID=1578 RepID=UPI001194478D|nr:phage antirepressor [Lactobacillus jensenii]MCF1778180.1 phage antirepressor [Lactobacillus jensenii]TVV23144.1 phage repressor protein/antirepressor Ant [Lactobacillus jensenii]